MAKKKNNQTVVNNIESVNVDIDYDKLAEAIVKAQKIEKEQQIKEKEQAFIEWRNSLGYKEYSNKNKIAKKFLTFGNRIKVSFKLMFLSKNKKIEASFSAIFLQTLLVGFFNFLKLATLISSILFIVFIFYHPEIDFEKYHYIVLSGLAIFLFLYSRFFRLISIEIDQMNDKEQLLSLFTAVVAIIPLVEIAFNFLKGVGWWQD